MKWHHSFRVHTSNKHHLMFLLSIFVEWERTETAFCRETVLPIWLWCEGSSAFAELRTTVPEEGHADNCINLHIVTSSCKTPGRRAYPEHITWYGEHYKCVSDASPSSHISTVGLCIALLRLKSPDSESPPTAPRQRRISFKLTRTVF